MKKKNYSGYIIGAIIILLGLWMVVTYNGLVKKDEKVKLQWNEVQNTYQRRLDLIPPLLNIVKGGADYEQTTLRKIIEARSAAASVNVTATPTAERFARQTAAQDQLATSTNRLMITVEKYPELKGTKSFLDLQTQLEGTERRIKVARKDFNVAMADYNSSVRSFPTKLAAGILGFSPRNGFEAEQGSDKSVEIKF